MRQYLLVAALLASLTVTGCRRMADATADSAAAALPDPAGQAGRTGYIGIGIYAPSVSWQRLVDAKASTPANDGSARKVDDQALIVVQNSRTGDIRVCGDMTGYCVGMNPWAKRAGQLTPVSLTDHQPTESEAAAAQKQTNEAEAKKQAAILAALRHRHHKR